MDQQHVIYYCESQEKQLELNHNVEYLVIFNLTNNKQFPTPRIILDLDDSNEKFEDPSKLFQISPNNDYLAVRENNTGVKFISLVDGTQSFCIPNIQKMSITQILYLDDETLLTCGEDKHLFLVEIAT